jgi:hypothetical protein
MKLLRIHMTLVGPCLHTGEVIRLRLYKARERQRVIDPADLEAAYFAVDPQTKPVFEHDGVMVWVSDPGHCRVERRIRGRDLHLVESGTNVLPRARGLEILRTPGADYAGYTPWTGAGAPVSTSIATASKRPSTVPWTYHRGPRQKARSAWSTCPT